MEIGKGDVNGEMGTQRAGDAYQRRRQIAEANSVATHASRKFKSKFPGGYAPKTLIHRRWTQGDACSMTKSDALVVNRDLASADMRFVAPDLVKTDASGAPHLIGGHCRKCQAQSFPRAAVCTNCLSEEIDTVELADQGVLYSYSIVHQAPKGWAVPYALGYVDLPGDIRVLAHLDVPAGKISINMPMRLGVGVVGADAAGAPLYSYTFQPA